LADCIGDPAARGRDSFARAVGDVVGRLELESTRVQQRLLALGAADGAEAVLSGFRDRLVDLIVPLIEETPALACPLPFPPPQAGEGGGGGTDIVDQAADLLRARWFKDIETQCEDYSDRDSGQRPLGTLAEWGAWALLRDRAERLLALAPEEEEAMFHTMYVRVCNFAVFQHNICLRRHLAHEIYAWLHRHAGSDRTAADLLMRNMKASETP
jgi:hypothetical protein